MKVHAYLLKLSFNDALSLRDARIISRLFAFKITAICISQPNQTLLRRLENFYSHVRHS
jgi:hypothetical protein